MSSAEYIGGVDFSGARGALANLWSAAGVERGGRLHVLSLRPHAFRPDLADYLAGGWRDELGAGDGAAMLVGLDFPLGLPGEAAAQAVAPDIGWRRVNAWLAERSAEEVADVLTDYRKTPRACDQGTAMAPLDLRVLKQTVEGARWLHELLAPGRVNGGVSILPQAPAPDAALTLIEVYPTGTAKDVGIKAPRRPRAPGQAPTRPAALREYVAFDHPATEATACALEDAWDAVLAALTAFFVRGDLGQPARTRGADDPRYSLEGWIYRHPEAWAR